MADKIDISSIKIQVPVTWERYKPSGKLYEYGTEVIDAKPYFNFTEGKAILHSISMEDVKDQMLEAIPRLNPVDGWYSRIDVPTLGFSMLLT